MFRCSRHGLLLCAPLLLLACSGVSLALTPPGGVPIPSYADYGDPDDQFGVELDVDGNWMATTGINGEAYYVYEKAGSSWLRRQRIVPPTLGQTGPVTPDLRGNRLLISRAFGVAGDGSGRVYVYERPNAGSPFVFVSTVQPEDPQAGNRFGYGIAQSDDRMFVGAPGRTEGTNFNQGVVYVFALQAGNWVQNQRIAQSDPTVADRFGFALDFDGQDLLVGARGHRSNVGGNTATRGAVYFYRYLPGPAAWVQTQKLVHNGTTLGTQFGYGLVAKNGVMAVLAPSSGQRALWIANRDGGGNWVVTQTFNNNFLDGTGFVGQPFYVDMGASTVAISMASFNAAPPNATGPNYTVTYQFAAGAWSRVQQIPRVDGVGVFSSAAIGVEANHVLVGQPFDDAHRNFDQGSIQAFANSNGTLTPTQKIWHGSGNSPDRLGSNVGIDGDWAITTASGADTPAGTDVGEAYFLKRQSNGAWEFMQTTGLLLSNGQPGMVDIVGNLAFVGLPNHSNFGRVQVLQRQPDDRWTPLCTLQTGAAGSQLGQFLQADSSGVVASYSSAPAAPLQMMFFPLPSGSTCPSGEVLPPPQGIDPTYTGAISISGNRVAVGWSTFSEGSPPINVFRQGVDVLQINNPGFSLVQTFSGNQTTPAADRYTTPSLEGNRLSLLYWVPVTTLDQRRDIRLYELIGPSYVLQATITSPYPTSGYGAAFYSGSQVLAADPNIGLYGSVAVFQASTGAFVQNILPSGLGVEDGGLYSLAVSGNRALLGFAEHDRGGVNNSGLVYVAENATPSADQANGPPNPWQVTPVESLPRPDRVFEHDFEENF